MNISPLLPLALVLLAGCATTPPEPSVPTPTPAQEAAAMARGQAALDAWIARVSDENGLIDDNHPEVIAAKKRAVDVFVQRYNQLEAKPRTAALPSWPDAPPAASARRHAPISSGPAPDPREASPAPSANLTSTHMGGGMSARSGYINGERASLTDMDMGGGMRSTSGYIGDQRVSCTTMDLGGGMVSTSCR